MQLHIGQHYQFNPSIVMTIITILFGATCCKLGFWQIDRYHQKQVLIEQLAQNPTLPPLPFAEIPASTTQAQVTLRYRQAKLTGYFINQHSFLLDNQFNNHKAGFHIISPFKVTGRHTIMLVDRGFIPRSNQRLDTPKIPPILGKQSITVRLETLTPSSLLLGKNLEVGLNKTPILQQIDTEFLKKQLRAPLKAMLGQLQSPSLSGGQLSWGNKSVLSPSRHLGYAAQWFLFALIALCLYAFLNTSRGSNDYESN